jgi:hypothetical protein
MPTEPTRAPVNPPEASDGRRLHIHGIKEMPAGYDAEVAELFRDLRAASNLSEADLAATLATRTEVVQALEQGALYALPPWPETSRVVNSYGLLLNLDVRPLLRRIYAQVEPSSTGQDSYAAAESRPEPQAAPSRSPLDIPFESEQRQPQPYPEPQRAPQQNWAPQPQDRRMQPRAPGAPMPGRLGPQAPQMPRQAPRPPQANPVQARPPQQRAQPQAMPQSVPPQARAPQAAPPPRPQISQASAPAAKPVEAKPAPEKKSRRGRALKWGIAAVVLIAAVTGFFALRSDPGLIGFSNPSQSGGKADKPTDPDDPRSHKADRLPSPNGL